MNKLQIVGNVTKDPDVRVTASGKSVCNFTVAVNRRFSQNNETDYFRCTVWDKLADICGKSISKGKKVAVSGSVSVTTFTGSDGKMMASLTVNAEEVEFLSPKQQPQQGYVDASDEELPFH